jgi:YbbR domain-containing protein
MNWLRKLLTENVGYKLLSLALAVTLWIAVGSDPVTEATFRVPVEFVNVPANLELLTEQPSVQLWARGPSHAIRQASAADFAVRVNAAAISGPGENTFSLDAGRVSAPTPLEVKELIPSEVRVIFERTASKSVTIRPTFSGEPLPGLRVKRFTVNESEARIAGPASHVDPLTEAATDPIDLARLGEAKTFVTNVYVSDSLVRILNPRSIRVAVELESSATPGATAPAGKQRSP